MYVSILHNVSTSLYLGVRPARTTLSEHAMHSMQSKTGITSCITHNGIPCRKHISNKCIFHVSPLILEALDFISKTFFEDISEQ